MRKIQSTLSLTLELSTQNRLNYREERKYFGHNNKSNWRNKAPAQKPKQNTTTRSHRKTSTKPRENNHEASSKSHPRGELRVSSGFVPGPGKTSSFGRFAYGCAVCVCVVIQRPLLQSLPPPQIQSIRATNDTTFRGGCTPPPEKPCQGFRTMS